MQKGKLVVISGPSAGVGKDTIVKMFLNKYPDWQMPSSITTRQQRPGEVDGKDMTFVDRATFEKWRNESKFLESILVDDNQWYGTLRKPVEDLLDGGKNVILRKDVRGALLIKKALPYAVLAFITAESWETLEQRIRARGTEDETSIKRRLKLAKTELSYKDKFDYIITNPTGHPEQALADLENAIWHS
jgi:guanylate kinase